MNSVLPRRGIGGWTALVILFLLQGGKGAAAETTPDPDLPRWALTAIDLDVTVLPAEAKLLLSGRLTIELEQDSAREIPLALNARKKGLMRLEEISAEGAEGSLSEVPDRPETQLLRIALPRTHRRGERVEVRFRGESAGASSQLLVSDRAALASWVELWYPAPLGSFTAPPSSAAPGATTFHLPPGWRSVGNGVLVSSETDADGMVRERWETELPLARSFVAAPFAFVETVRQGDRSVGFYLLRKRDNSAKQSSQLAGAISAMEKRFGSYPYPSWNIAEVPEGVSFAASSEQGFMMVRSSLLDQKEGNLPLFAHEASHAWWGNIVRGRGDGSKMVTEALAQYGAVIAIEAIEGKAAAAEFLRFSREGYNPLQCALGYFHIWREGGDKPLSKLTNARWDHNLSDSKGHWFYHMLRQRVGDGAFFSTLRSLLQKNAGGSISLDDLRAAFLQATGDPGLSPFFSQWLDRAGAPVLELRWWSMSRGTIAEIHIEQVQEGEPFHIPLDVEVDTADGPVRETLDLRDRAQAFSVSTGSRPLRVNLDPETKVLIWRPEYGPPPVGERASQPAP